MSPKSIFLLFLATPSENKHWRPKVYAYEKAYIIVDDMVTAVTYIFHKKTPLIFSREKVLTDGHA
ncbi:MAG: hypothetical protein N5P05_003232 [Chroococcopsis gigantea SAG 12.99]|jgi:hypothetical protein|nr:hypothetical protein [Chroococcopsis gigantea SAG 12.99]